TESGRKAQEQLKINRNYFIDYVGYELLQELRAVSLRVESYLHELIHDVYNQINENINETDNTYLLSSLKDYEVITPDYEQAFLNIDYSKFEHALKTFKNTKSFFEKNEREKMKDMFYNILEDDSNIYLVVIEDNIQQSTD